MSVRKKSHHWMVSLFFCALLPMQAIGLETVSNETIAEQLGWVNDPANPCSGYFFEKPFPTSEDNQDAIRINSGQTLFSRNGTSILEGNVSMSRFGQQLTANKAFLFRDPNTRKLSAMEMIGDVHLREPNTLVIAKKGRYYFDTKKKSLRSISYRTAFSKNNPAPAPTHDELESGRKLPGLTAWGQANDFSQTVPGIFDLTDTSFTTCPPTETTWHVKASHIELNKNTGRGYATNARLFMKGVPIFYWPYISFSLDHQRKTGFLWPTIGSGNKWGPYVLAPIYLNLAPNYDMTVTPGYLSKRGMQLNDQFNYLNTHGSGNVYVSVLPHDRAFSDFQASAIGKYGQSTSSTTQAELNRLTSASPTRKSLNWKDSTHFNDHLSSKVDFNYVSDNYYLRDFGKNLTRVTDNQLLQEADLFYKGSNWNLTGRIQAYQTLHPIDESDVANQYRRFPQLVANADYPNQFLGLDYFLNSEFTHFDIRNTPGTATDLPVGNRMNLQPGVSLPLYLPYLYVNPRFQVALTQYQLYQTLDTGLPTTQKRAVPIFDVAAGMTFSRDASLFQHRYLHTLEPQIYYTYIPYRNQSNIPILDTTVNTLTYDQLFNYNRFSSIDRIGDANQVGVGFSTRLIDANTGLEKVRAGLGAILYFRNRRVTFCNDDTCTDNPQNHSNEQRLSPLSGTFDYHINETWRTGVNAIWNPISKQISNSTLGLHYQPDSMRIINLGYSFVRNGETTSGITTNATQDNLKLTDISFAWPIKERVSAVGRWSQDFSQNHFQNILYGIQYDSCCWAIRLVGGRAFTNLSLENTPQYNNEFYIQFAFKGLGNVGSGNPSGLLASISGYNTDFEGAST